MDTLSITKPWIGTKVGFMLIKQAGANSVIYQSQAPEMAVVKFKSSAVWWEIDEHYCITAFVFYVVFISNIDFFHRLQDLKVGIVSYIHIDPNQLCTDKKVKKTFNRSQNMNCKRVTTKYCKAFLFHMLIKLPMFLWDIQKRYNQKLETVEEHIQWC